jgi:alpha-L-fucosidase 2
MLVIKIKDEQVIMILPALPKAWNNGSVRGLKARGGLTVESMKWENRSATELVLKADHDVKFQLRINGKIEHLALSQGESYRYAE